MPLSLCLLLKITNRLNHRLWRCDRKRFNRSGVVQNVKKAHPEISHQTDNQGEPMQHWNKQSHVTWHCLYHVVFIPKYRKKAIFGSLRKEIGGIFRELCQQFGIGLIEGHAMPDHIHMCLSIPPRYAVAQAIGKLKGKSAILIYKRYLGRGKNLSGYHFWARGYCVNTVGLNEEEVRAYIRNQESHDKVEDQYLLPLR